MAQIALIKAVREGDSVTIDCEGNIRDILTTIGVALYDIESQLSEDVRAEFRSDVLASLEAPRKRFKGEKINENC